MADTQTVKDIATLMADIKHIQEAMEAQEKACKIRDENAMERIKVLEFKLGKAEKYGWFFMGMVAVGATVAAGIEKVLNKITALAP